MNRVYLDHNATTPLRPEAREAMQHAMDVVGNPSSVHAEGRAAKAIVEKARGQVAALVGVETSEVVFCGSATEAAAQVLAMPWARVFWTGVEHDCIAAHVSDHWYDLPLEKDGVRQTMPMESLPFASGDLLVVQLANSETGVTQDDFATMTEAAHSGALALIDTVQMCGKSGCDFGASPRKGFHLMSAHKIGGPKGVAALIVPTGTNVTAMISGGGQEMGRRSGTENVIGIAGFGAAAQAAQRDVEAGRWDRVEKLRNILENALAAASKTTIFVGKEAPRLPNTSCFITPGWKGETQVMQMDLAGFAISAGSACSSGKVKASRVLKAMGYSGLEAASAVRVSLGLDTTEDEVLRFAEAWTQKLKKHEARAA
ncbi:MAG: aminotransferase class V-fold PLP-dependent enzyme [Pseudomonadota bacterium]